MVIYVKLAMMVTSKRTDFALSVIYLASHAQMLLQKIVHHAINLPS